MRTPAEHQELARIVLNARITQREQAQLLDALYDLEVMEAAQARIRRESNTAMYVLLTMVGLVCFGLGVRVALMVSDRPRGIDAGAAGHVGPVVPGRIAPTAAAGGPGPRMNANGRE